MVLAPLPNPTLRAWWLTPSTRSRQELRDLHRVQRRALEQLIGGDEHRDRVAGRVAQVLPDAADQHVVLA